MTEGEEFCSCCHGEDTPWTSDTGVLKLCPLMMLDDILSPHWTFLDSNISPAICVSMATAVTADLRIVNIFKFSRLLGTFSCRFSQKVRAVETSWTIWCDPVASFQLTFDLGGAQAASSPAWCRLSGSDADRKEAPTPLF